MRRAATTRHHTVALVGAITAVALGLRLWGLGDKSLWIDESFSHWIASQPFDAIWRWTVEIDEHPPLYYALLHLWISGGGSEVALRGLSVLFGVAVVPVVYLIGRDAGGRRLGLLAATLQAVSPLHVWYGQQARMYTMLTFFAAATACCLVRLLTAGRTLSSGTAAACWAGFVVGIPLTMLSHNTAVLFPAAIVAFLGAAALLRARRRADPDATVMIGTGMIGTGATDPAQPYRIRQFALATAAGVVLWLPWLPSFLHQSGKVDDEFWIAFPTVTKVLEHIRDLGSARSPGLILVPLVLVFAVLAALGARRLRRRPEIVMLLVALMIVPPVAELLISLRRPIFYSQTLVWTSVPLTVLMAAGLLALRRPRLVGAATGTLLLLNVLSLVDYYRDDGTEEWRGAAQYVAAAARPGDLLLFDAGWTQIPFDYYFHDRYVHGGGPPLTEHGLPADMFERGVLEPKTTAADVPRIDELIAGRSRVWVVYSHDGYTDPQHLVAGHLDTVLNRIARREFRSIGVATYERRT